MLEVVAEAQFIIPRKELAKGLRGAEHTFVSLAVKGASLRGAGGPKASAQEVGSVGWARAGHAPGVEVPARGWGLRRWPGPRPQLASLPAAGIRAGVPAPSWRPCRWPG